MLHSVQSSGVHWTADIGIMFVVIQSIFQWNPVDWDWTLKSGLESSESPVDWTGLDWALYQPIWPGKRATGIHWSPLESIWNMWGRVKTSLQMMKWTLMIFQTLKWLFLMV